MRGWLKLNRSEFTEELLLNHDAFMLLTQIAYRAKRTDNFCVNGLKPGQALIGDYKKIGLSEQRYRTSKRKLELWKLATFQGTNKGTVATLLNSSVYDINTGESNEPNNETITNQQRTDNEPATTNKNVRKKEDKNKKKSAVSAKPCSSTDISLTNIFVAYLETNISKPKIPKDLTKWRNDMRLIRETDKRSPDEIMAVILSLENVNVWWTENGNIQSVKALRTQFPRLHTTMTSKPRQSKKQQDNLAFIESLKVKEPLRVEAITTKRIGG